KEEKIRAGSNVGRQGQSVRPKKAKEKARSDELDCLLARSIVAAQINARIQRSNLVAIAVIHAGGHTTGKQSAANNPFCRLAPARMGNIRVHIGVEAILA